MFTSFLVWVLEIFKLKMSHVIFQLTSAALEGGQREMT